MSGTLPARLPQELTVTGTVTVATPTGLEQREVTARFPRRAGLVEVEEFQIAAQGYKLPRNAAGVVRETRGIWASTSDIATAAGIDELVDRRRSAGLNTIIPDIFVRNTFVATSKLMPTADSVGQDFDPLRYLIQKARAVRFEVHPWFCVTYRDRHFRRWFADKFGPTSGSFWQLWPMTINS